MGPKASQLLAMVGHGFKGHGFEVMEKLPQVRHSERSEESLFGLISKEGEIPRSARNDNVFGFFARCSAAA